MVSSTSPVCWTGKRVICWIQRALLFVCLFTSPCVKLTFFSFLSHVHPATNPAFILSDGRPRKDIWGPNNLLVFLQTVKWPRVLMSQQINVTIFLMVASRPFVPTCTNLPSSFCHHLQFILIKLEWHWMIQEAIYAFCIFTALQYWMNFCFPR